jgi:hypothetical protein
MGERRKALGSRGEIIARAARDGFRRTLAAMAPADRENPYPLALGTITAAAGFALRARPEEQAETLAYILGAVAATRAVRAQERCRRREEAGGGSVR